MREGLITGSKVSSALGNNKYKSIFKFIIEEINPDVFE